MPVASRHGVQLSLASSSSKIGTMLSRLQPVLITAMCLSSGAPLIGAQAAVAPHPRSVELNPSQRVEALIERVRIEQSKITDLTADFVQVKESALLLEPLESSGEFAYAAPDRVRWEYERPDPISILIHDQEMITWYRDIQRAELVSVGRQSQRVLEYLGATSSLDDLLEYFLVTLTVPTDPAEPYVFSLAPKFDKVAKRIQGMTIWIDSEHFLPNRLRYVEADGDITDLRFEHIVINSEVPDEHFELQLPSTVEVRRIELESASLTP